MKKLSIVLALLSALTITAAEKAAPQKEGGDFLSGVYIAPVGIIKYANLTDKPQYGAGMVAGYLLNKHVSLDATLIAFESPDNWGGSAVDETDVNANFVLFKANKLSVYGVAGGARDWSASDWGLNLGAGLEVNVYKKASVFGQYVYQVWKEREQSGQITFGIAYAF